MSDVFTKSGLNLSNWDENQIPTINGYRESFGQYLKRTEPEEWDNLIKIAQKVLNNRFKFLLDWKLDNRDIKNHATILLTGGIIYEYGFDYRIAGVFAANVL